MKICKNGMCPIDNVEKCCAFCEKKATCDKACSECNNTECANMQEVETSVTEFKKNEIALINTITTIENQKKALEEKSKTMREQLLLAMEKYAVKKFENGTLSVTYVAPTTKTTIDTTRLKKEQPEIAQKYTKTSDVKASIKITIKDK